MTAIYDAQKGRYSLEEKILDSTHSVDSCLVDIIHSAKIKKEAEIIQPPLMRQLMFLVFNYTIGWALAWAAVIKQDDPGFTKEQVYILVILAATGPGLSAFLVQYFYDEGCEGVSKLFRRCNPKMITKEWWVGSFLLIPSTMAVMSGIYVWFGGDPPPIMTGASFFNFFLLSIPVAVGEEFGWRGMMLPETQNVIDGWYFQAYGSTSANDGVPYWESGDNEVDENGDLRSLSSGVSTQSYSALETTPLAGRDSITSRSMNAKVMNTVIEAEDEEASDVASEVAWEDPNPNDPPHWKWSPVLASLFIGLVWGTWYLPAFFVHAIHHQYCNFAQYVIEQMFLSIFYTWQSNNTGGSILAAIITHSLQQSFRKLNPWGEIEHPNFFALPNSVYQLELLCLTAALVWVVGPELGRGYNKRPPVKKQK